MRSHPEASAAQRAPVTTPPSNERLQDTRRVNLAVGSAGLKSSQVLIDQIFQSFLPPGTRLRVEPLLKHVLRQVAQAQLTAQNALAELLLLTGVALVDHACQLAVRQHALGNQERASQRIDAADVRMKQILRIHALAPELGVEIHAAGAEASA